MYSFTHRASAAVGAVLMAAALVITDGGAAHAQSASAVRIMPLGDSITDGHNVPGGYRVALWQKFDEDGTAVDFVGSAANGPSTLGDRNHEGHSGWRIDQIDANAVRWMRASAPRTVLLHVGTNDIRQSYDVANAPARLSGLIDKILQVNPDVELFVAQLIPEADPTFEARILAYNAALPGIVQQKAQAGFHVRLVDMHSALTTADLADGVHPSASGYAKMAAAWHSALRAAPLALTPSPEPQVDVPGRLGTSNSSRCLDVTGYVTAPGTPLILWNCHTAGNQRFTRSATAELRVFGNRCLEPSGTSLLTALCTGSDNQKWVFRVDGRIVGTASGLCMTPAGGGTANHTPIKLVDCSTAPAQRWVVR
ncbi:lipase [Dactylosporangium sucinum]|uniref:Lipase n=2 Tax=Dactylosporangium sucinum TaxID=1424081 RepID=A0A917X1G9_9ACTN|nr:lipase [Dactylosporangium sucinum]